VSDEDDVGLEDVEMQEYSIWTLHGDGTWPRAVPKSPLEITDILIFISEEFEHGDMACEPEDDEHGETLAGRLFYSSEDIIGCCQGALDATTREQLRSELLGLCDVLASSYMFEFEL